MQVEVFLLQQKYCDIFNMTKNIQKHFLKRKIYNIYFDTNYFFLNLCIVQAKKKQVTFTNDLLRTNYNPMNISKIYLYVQKDVICEKKQANVWLANYNKL